MKKKLYIFIFGIVVAYISIFIGIGIITIILPSTVYDNQKLLSNNHSSANKMNYKLSRHEGVTNITCGKMQGMDIIWECETDEDIVRQMDYNFDVTSGKAKIVLIQPDDTVITLVEQDRTAIENGHASELSTAGNREENASAGDSMVALDLKKGRNYMKIVCGKGTSFSLSFEIPE